MDDLRTPVFSDQPMGPWDASLPHFTHRGFGPARDQPPGAPRICRRPREVKASVFPIHNAVRTTNPPPENAGGEQVQEAPALAHGIVCKATNTPKMPAKIRTGPGTSRITSVDVDCLACAIRGTLGGNSRDSDSWGAELPSTGHAIVDCRWPYEYEAGHVIGAANLFSEEQISTYFFGQEIRSRIMHCPSLIPKTVFLHCEYSQFRAPKLAAAFMRMRRKFLDEISHDPRSEQLYASGLGPQAPWKDTRVRSRGDASELQQGHRNEDQTNFSEGFVQHPPGRVSTPTSLTLQQAIYPQVFVVEGGYRAFHDKYEEFCFPSGYVEETDPVHTGSMMRFRKQFCPELLSEID